MTGSLQTSQSGVESSCSCCSGVETVVIVSLDSEVALELMGGSLCALVDSTRSRYRSLMDFALLVVLGCGVEDDDRVAELEGTKLMCLRFNPAPKAFRSCRGMS